MFLNVFFLDPAVLLGFCFLVTLAMSGFIGNLNINSDDGNVSVNGSNVKTILIDEFEEDVDSLNASSLCILNPVGGIKITTNNDNKFHLARKLYASDSITEMEKTELKAVFREKILSVEDDIVKLQVPKLTTMDVLSVKVDLELSIPKAFNVVQEPGVNDLSVVDLGGTLDITHNVGNIDLKSIAGTTKIKSNSSSITAEDLGDLAYLVVNAGNVNVKSAKVVSRDSVINVNAGNIELDIDEINDQSECNLEAGAGEIFVTINKDANILLKAVSNIGSVKLDSGITVVSEEKQFMGASVTAKVNNSGGSLFVNSNTGNINIKLR